MARPKKRRIWTVCYAITNPAYPDDPYFGSWFAYGTTKEEAAANYLEQKKFEAEECGECPVEWFSIVHVVEGFSC